MRRAFTILLLVLTIATDIFAVGHDHNPQKGTIGFRWDKDDMCGILTTSNTEIIHWATTADDNMCTLSAYGWYLMPNTSYYAYSPYSQTYATNDNPMTALPVSYKEQSQTENNSLSHIHSYDYMSAQSVSTSDACHFYFQHHGSIMRIECTMPSTQTLKRLTLTASKEVFTTEATMNVIDGTLTPTTKESAITLALNGMTVEKDEQLVLYLMLPPADLTGMKLTLKLMATSGDSSTTEIQGTEVLAGCLYPLLLDMPEFEVYRGWIPPEYLANSNTWQSMPEVHATSDRVDAVTAYAPDFFIDPDHSFEQVTEDNKEDNIATMINVTPAGTQNSDMTAYDINGMRVTTIPKGKIIINGRAKYIKTR